MRHELKTDPEVFKAIFSENKPYTIRFDDRGYSVLDELVLKETKYTGEEMKNGKPLIIFTGIEIIAWVTHVLRGPIYGLKRGWVILSLRIIEKRMTR